MDMIKRIALWAAGVVVCAAAVTTQAAPSLGEAPPDYLGVTPQGQEVRISDRRGKVVMVSFWASWCGYCRRQFPVLDAFQQVYPPERLEVIVVNYKEPVRDYRAAVRQARKSPVMWTHDADGAIAGAFGVSSVPQLFIVDRRGNRANVQRGYAEGSPARLERIVKELLAD